MAPDLNKLSSRAHAGRCAKDLNVSFKHRSKQEHAHPMTTLVKICGITRAQDARLAEKLGAWALGFNFYEKSPRAVAPADAWNIRRKLAPTTQAVGVFVNWKP